MTLRNYWDQKTYGKTSFLWKVVQFILDNELCGNKQRFKVGDKVRYNWMAKAQIMSAITHKVNKTLTVTRVGEGWQTYVELDVPGYGEDGCDAFWLRKAYFFER